MNSIHIGIAQEDLRCSHAIPPMTDSRNRAYCMGHCGTSPFCPIRPMVQWIYSRDRAYCMGSFGIFPICPIHPMVQCDGMDSRNRAYCMGSFGIFPVCPIHPMVQWDGMDSRNRAYCMGRLGMFPNCPIHPMDSEIWDTMGHSGTFPVPLMAGTVG